MKQDLASIREAIERLSTLSDDRRTWLNAKEKLSQARQEQQRLSALEKQIPKAEQILQRVTEELGLSSLPNKQDLSASHRMLHAGIDQELLQVEEQKNERDRLLSQIRVLSDVARKRAELAERLTEIRTQYDRAARVLKRVEDLKKKAKQIRKIALKTQEDLMHTTFDERVNALVNDLYGRLVKDEKFRPHIVPPSLSRGVLTANIQAIANGEKAYEDLEAVVSSGNLNTAALSLFIALHLIEKPRLKVLVFDDPVQSMDDVHVVQLAAVLRSLAYDPSSQRQVIVAVHERELYDYLCLELGPTRSADSLLATEIIRENSGRVRIDQERHEWRTDKVRFGT